MIHGITQLPPLMICDLSIQLIAMMHTNQVRTCLNFLQKETLLLFRYNKIIVILVTIRYVLLKITIQTTALKTWIFSSSNVAITKIFG